MFEFRFHAVFHDFHGGHAFAFLNINQHMVDNYIDICEASELTGLTRKELLEKCRAGDLRPRYQETSRGGIRLLIDRNELVRRNREETWKALRRRPPGSGPVSVRPPSRATSKRRTRDRMAFCRQDFGARLYRRVVTLMDHHDLKKTELAEAIGADVGNTYAWDKRRAVPLQRIGEFCDLFGLTPNQLLEFEPLPQQLPRLRIPSSGTE